MQLLSIIGYTLEPTNYNLLDHPETAATEEHKSIWLKTTAVIEAQSLKSSLYKTLKSTRVSDCRVLAQETHVIVVASLELNFLFFLTCYVSIIIEGTQF